MIKYKTIKNISPGKLYDLYKSVSWTRRFPDKKKHGLLIARVHRNSDSVFSAWEKEELVGIVRVVTDKLTHAIIFGLAINPKYKDRGIAEELTKRCIKKYSKMQINLESEKDSYKLFKSLGFKDSPYKSLFMGNFVI